MNRRLQVAREPDRPRRPVTVLLVEDHERIRRSVRLLLTADERLDVIGEAGDAATALQLLLHLHPDVAVLDLQLPDASGLPLLATVRATAPDTAVIVITLLSSEALARRLQGAGARGCVLMEHADHDLRMAIHAAASGDAYYVSPDICG